MTPAKLIEKEEGFEPLPYPDTHGYLTIGHGFLIDSRKAGAGISEEESLLILKHRLKHRVMPQLDAKIPWWRSLNAARRAILLSMAWQMGVPGLLRFKRTLAAIQEGDYARGARGMMSSLWARQTPGRAKRHADVMRNGRF
jgi:lysozyme